MDTDPPQDRVGASRIASAFDKVWADLNARRRGDNHWVGRLASSALSTATAVSALAIVQSQLRHASSKANESPASENDASDPADGTSDGAETPLALQLAELIERGINWLGARQNGDGGWGDTDLSHSNISTTMLVKAAFALSAVPANADLMMDRADEYIERQGGIRGLRRRYGKDKTFAVPILANCAMAGMVPWRKVSALPFELSVVPQKFYHLLQLPVVSYAIPALVAIGQVRYHFAKPLGPVRRWLRKSAIDPSLRVLQRMQPESGGFLEAIPLTSFVVMSLAAMGRHNHPVARRGLKFIIDSIRDDGSWPIDTNLATWTTTLAINAAPLEIPSSDVEPLTRWVLSCQFRETHPYTGSAPGGWGWSDLSGAVPDADDTPGALLALAALRARPETRELRDEIDEAAQRGMRWLLDLQNRDGGWPTFCRGWGNLPFDRSGSDLTAHVMRAMECWSDIHLPEAMRSDVSRARRVGLRYLERSQRPDGTWIPLWFGNQDHADEENPIYGTARVLMALRDLGLSNCPMAVRGRAALTNLQNIDGGWGGGWPAGKRDSHPVISSIEETAVAVEACLEGWKHPPERRAVLDGVKWLLRQIDADEHRRVTPIGFYFAKLWYYEELYPLTFLASTLARLRGVSLDQPSIVEPTAPGNSREMHVGK